MESLRKDILELDLDLIAGARFDRERGMKLRSELAKSATARAQSERKRLAEGRNEGIEREFAVREEIKRLLDESHPLKSDGVRELMRQRRKAIEASVAEASAPELAAEIRASARGERVLEDQHLLTALGVTETVDGRIQEIVVAHRRSRAHADFVQVRGAQISRVWPKNVPGRDLVRAAFEQQPQMSRQDMVKFTISTFTQNHEHLDSLHGVTTVESALEVLDRVAKDFAAAARAVGDIPGFALQPATDSLVAKSPAPAKRACRVRRAPLATGEHPDADVRALKYSLLEGFDCTFKERREFFYLWKGDRVYEHGGAWMMRGGTKVVETGLARAAARRDTNERMLRAASLRPEVELEFLRRTDKTDKDFWDPQIVKEDLYLGHKNFDSNIMNSIRAEAACHFIMLDDDCSVPWKRGSVSWTPGKSFSIDSERFKRIYTAKAGMPARRAKLIERYWTLVAFADPSAAREFLFDPAKDPHVLQTRLGGRRHPHGEHTQLYDELRVMVFSRVGILPAVYGGFKYEAARFQDFRASMQTLVGTIPTRMAEWVSVAVDESSPTFLADVDVLMARHGVTQASWTNYNFRGVLPPNELFLLARWAQAFLSTGNSKLREMLGRAPGNDSTRVIESAIRPVPVEFSWSALAEGTEISPLRVKDLIRWATKEDACCKSDPWKFTADPPRKRARTL